MNPLVSIIIPTYSRPGNLCRAIDSVLVQTYSPIEILVVDDNGVGTEHQLETEKVLAPYLEENQIIYLKHEVNKNGSAARNTGSRASNGEFIGYLDDDDVFFPTKIEKQVARLQEAHSANPKVAGVYCNTEKTGYAKKSFQYVSQLEGNLAEKLMLEEVSFNSSTLLIYRYAYEALNGWDERFLRHQDWEFCIRFFRQYEIAVAEPNSCLIGKYNTPNFNAVNPKKLVTNMEFYINEMAQDIEAMPRKNEVYSFRYLWIVRQALAHRQYKLGFEYISKMKERKRLKFSDYLEILKNLIKSIIYW